MNRPEILASEANETVECVPLLDHNSALHISVIPAVCIVALLSIIHRRPSTNCSRCGWIPGAVVPLNFLDGYKNRWSLAAAFGAISSRIPQLLGGAAIFRDTALADAPASVQRTLLVLLAVTECTVAFYPLFACILSPSRLIASTLGLCYSLFWLIVQLIHVFSCPSSADPSGSLVNLPVEYTKLITQWPSCIFFGFLLAAFVRILVKSLRSKRFRQKDYHCKRQAMGNLSQLPSFQMGLWLFWFYLCSATSITSNDKSPKPTDEEGLLETFRYTRYAGFRYPSRLFCILSITLSLSYQISMEALVYAIVIAESVADRLSTFIISTDFHRITKTAVIILTACIWITWAFLVLLLISSLFLIFKNYRSHFLQLCRGDKAFSSRSTAYSSASELLVASMRYAGYQIAYFVSGYAVFYIVIFIFLLITTEGLYIVIEIYGWDAILWVVEYLVVPLVFNIVLYYFQVFGSGRFFLQPSPGKDQPVPLSLRNKISLETVNFFTFFFNITIGIMSSLKRILQSIVLGLIIICRIDRTPFNRSFERFDRGHKAYIGMLYVDYTHNHPVLRVFCSILLKDEPKSAIRSVIASYHNISNEQAATNEKKQNSAARQKWHLAYTLIRNPQLVLQRKHLIVHAAIENDINIDVQSTNSDNGESISLSNITTGNHA